MLKRANRWTCLLGASLVGGMLTMVGCYDESEQPGLEPAPVPPADQVPPPDTTPMTPPPSNNPPPANNMGTAPDLTRPVTPGTPAPGTTGTGNTGTGNTGTTGTDTTGGT